MKLLVLSCGTRNKIVQYFRSELRASGEIIAADCSKLAPALYEADRYYVIPHMNTDGYLDAVFDICKAEQITGILSLIDPELSVLARHKDEFNSLGVTVITSGYDVCERCLDKYEMYKWLCANGFACAKSYIDIEVFEQDYRCGKIVFPVFVKPIRGSASISISKADDYDTLKFLFAHSSGMMIQECLAGQEIGADCYIDLISGECVSIFTKKKLLMRAGETDKSVSFKNDKLFELIEDFVRKCEFKGPIDIDIFDMNGVYYISEVNPRFGGGYPHAYACGVNHMKQIVNNLAGIENEKKIGCYDEGIYMMKYNDIMIIDGEENSR